MSNIILYIDIFLTLPPSKKTENMEIRVILLCFRCEKYRNLKNFIDKLSLTELSWWMNNWKDKWTRRLTISQRSSYNSLKLQSIFFRFVIDYHVMRSRKYYYHIYCTSLLAIVQRSLLIISFKFWCQKVNLFCGTFVVVLLIIEMVFIQHVSRIHLPLSIAGDPQSNEPGDGTEDESASCKQAKHVKGGTINEQTESS